MVQIDGIPFHDPDRSSTVRINIKHLINDVQYTLSPCDMDVRENLSGWNY
jgi:hypothetical protein